MITNEQEILIKRLYDNYSSQMNFIDDKDEDTEHLEDIILENLILCCRLNAILEVLDIIELDYKIEDGKIIFES